MTLVVRLSAIPPWIPPEETVDLTFSDKNNSRNLRQYRDKYHGYVQIYTDASRSLVGRVGDIVIEIQQVLIRIQMMGLAAILLLVAAHISITGNELSCQKKS